MNESVQIAVTEKSGEKTLVTVQGNTLETANDPRVYEDIGYGMLIQVLNDDGLENLFLDQLEEETITVYNSTQIVNAQEAEISVLGPIQTSNINIESVNVDLSNHEGITEVYTAKEKNTMINEADAICQSLMHPEPMNELQCQICGKQFVNMNALEIHEVSHEDNQNGECQFLCTFCGDKFDKGIALRTHLVKHCNTHIELYFCENCDMTFVDDKSLKEHSQVHLRKKIHTCQKCDKKFQSSYRLVRHMTIHTENLPFLCDQCGILIANKRNLKSHIMKHQSSAVCSCTIIHNKNSPSPSLFCKTAFNKPSELQRHKLVDSIEKPFSCEKCEVTFRNISNLKGHMITHSGIKPFFCLICNKGFARLSDVKRHIFTHSGCRPFACNICGLAFGDSSNLKKHSITHSKKDKKLASHHQCLSCCVSFYSYKQLNEHMTSGNCTSINVQSEPKYSCKECSATFNHALHLQEHAAIHSHHCSMHKCDVCNKSFIQESFLIAHKASHTESRPHCCGVCLKRFKTSSHLKNHMITHSDVKPFECTVCKKSFSKLASLKRHYVVHDRVNLLSAVCR